MYLIDGKEVTEEQWHANWHTPPPDYEKGECPAGRPDLNDFSTENSGKGRYNPQLATKPNDPKAYFRSAHEAKAEAERRGFNAELA